MLLNGTDYSFGFAQVLYVWIFLNGNAFMSDKFFIEKHPDTG